MKSLILIFALVSASVFGNNTDPAILGSVTGVVMDQQFQEPIPYASISVKNAEGDIVTGTVSSEDGTFSLEKLKEGTYTFQVQFMGYKTYTEEVVISDRKKDFQLGEIFLEADVAQLDDVTVVAERSTIEQRIDRKIINVGKDLTTQGPTASDIMNNIPSVSVDQDGNIALRGSQNVKVLVDGKPSNMDAATLLKTIPSTSIKKIELITNPSAKYDPEGMSGIINIVLHKNTNLGFNGDVSGGVTIGERTSWNGSLNMNYREGKFNFYTNLGANDRKNLLDGHIVNLTDGSGEYHDLLFGNRSYLGKFGVDFYLNERNTLSFFTRQNKFYEDFDGTVDVRYPNEPDRNYSQLFDTDQENISSTYNFVFLHDFEKEGHNLGFEVDYNEYTNEEEAFYSYAGNAVASPYQDDLVKDRFNTIANLDYVNPLSEKSKLELGAEARLLRIRNDYESTNEFINSTLYDYHRNIYSFYSTFGQDFGKWAYQVGARLENYNVEAIEEEAVIYEDDYLTLYPSAFVTYVPGEKNSFQVSYSRRVDRPSFGQVNPVRQFSTPRLTIVGNPELQPEFTNSYELNYTRKFGRNSLTAGVFYRRTTDDIIQTMAIDPQDEENIILTFANVGDNDLYGLEFSANLNPYRFWDLNASFNLYSQTLSGFIGTEYIEDENTNYRIQVNNTFKVTDRFRLQLFGMYNSPHSTLQFDIEDSYFFNAGARYSFWEDRASISLNVNDIFDTMSQDISTTRPLPQEGSFMPDTQTVYAGFSYRFGGGKNKALQRKQRDDNTANGGMF
ncbi:Outer membrane receptor proteins, mostly Fe transport [Salinimicrobium catena]|uniref:Outer membrane receptor proteins, mostly Fe transport n=1 Tax=Salinimicrobium catena TaxID=390640 RepID=A0A1H5NUH5_9FLAO|nr:TonB-dependent receptor [Salinimicrobium catena]SDL52586.1 Outer membrane receptor proteins, mostly Fe transport [Salinimicrobium catena]SEF04491.1 Outer membrane receptor proteins, mostly Fe transport [Salinimicrobium catena]